MSNVYKLDSHQYFDIYKIERLSFSQLTYVLLQFNTKYYNTICVYQTLMSETTYEEFVCNVRHLPIWNLCDHVLCKRFPTKQQWG